MIRHGREWGWEGEGVGGEGMGGRGDGRDRVWEGEGCNLAY